MLTGKTVLVTGATGRLGADLAVRLEELGARVLPLVLEGYPALPRRTPWRAQARPIPATDPTHLTRLPHPDYVVNLHWCVDRTLSFAKQVLHEIDYGLSRPAFLWDWLADTIPEAFVNVSTIKVFGPQNTQPIAADTEPLPDSPYGIAKVAGERFLDTLFGATPTRLSHIRLCSVASHGEHPTKLLARLCESALEGTPIRVFSNGASRMVHIDEAVDLLIGAATGGDGRYNVAPPSRSNREVADAFEQVTGRALNAEYVEDAGDDPDPEITDDRNGLTAEWMRRPGFEAMIQQVFEAYAAAKQPIRERGTA